MNGELVGKKLLLAASTGGHLAQLHRLSRRLGASDDSLWVTFDSPQSQTLLVGQRVLHVPYVSPRDLRGTFTAFRHVHRALHAESFDEAVSTGAGMAVGVFLAARLRGIPLTYIESVSRVRGPSMTGRFMAATRMTQLRTQHESWASRRWMYEGNVLEEFQSCRKEATPSVRRIFVTLGTIKPYRFDSAVDAVLRTGLAGPDTVWQLGETIRSGLPGESKTLVGGAEFERLARTSDVVVTHAGVGTLLQLLEWGIHPVTLVRRSDRGEHVDNHQEQIGALLGEADLATVVDPPALTREHLLQAASKYVRPTSTST